jgi:hypothetical protein
LKGGGDYFPGELSWLTDWDAGEAEAVRKEGAEEEAASFETDYAGDLREIVGRLDVVFQMRDYRFSGGRVPKNRKDVREELVLSLC